MGNSKCIKTSSEAEDRLSKLPECILCHILSFLPTEDAAKTSILSKMWRFLFLAVPKIDIDGSRSYGPQNALVCFINRRLMLCRTTSITEFRLICEQLPRASVVHLWLTALVLRNVEVLDIQLLGSEDCKFGEHFLWQSLMVLKLHSQCGEITFKLPESVLFPNLKVLNFTHIKLECQSETYKFSDQAFPRLEELRLEQVTYGDSVDPCLYISLSTLKKLSIEAIDSEYVIKLLDIHSPQLQHLELLMSGGPDLGTQINMCNLESIVSVHFLLCQQGDQFTNILSKVNNAKELALLVWAAEGLEKCVPLPQFPNLTHLKIGTPAKQLLWNVLQNSPNLETLDMKDYKLHHEDIMPCNPPDDMFEICCPHPENVPPCFGRTLREIYIGEFGQTEAEIEAVGFILQHGAVLHRLTLEDNYGQWELSTFNRLLKLKRHSPHCEIELV